MEQIKGLKSETRERFPQLFIYSSCLIGIVKGDWWEKYKQSSHYARRITKGSIQYEHLVYDQSLPIFKELLHKAIDLLTGDLSLIDDYKFEKEAEKLLYGEKMPATNFYWICLGAIEVMQKGTKYENNAGSSNTSQQVQAQTLSIANRRCY
jgi:hypothetical protein